MRHDFFIEDLGRPAGWFRPRRYRYSCLRCGWRFLVESRYGRTVAVNELGGLVPEPAQTQRVQTFGLGPCLPLEDTTGRRRQRPTGDKPARKVLRIRRRREEVAAGNVAGKR